jgi:hypothetical protein
LQLYVHHTTRELPPRGQFSRGIPEAAGRAWNCPRQSVRVGLKRIVPPLQGSGIGLRPVDPGRWPGLCCLAPLGLKDGCRQARQPTGPETRPLTDG